MRVPFWGSSHRFLICRSRSLSLFVPHRSSRFPLKTVRVVSHSAHIPLQPATSANFSHVFGLLSQAPSTPIVHLQLHSSYTNSAFRCGGFCSLVCCLNSCCSSGCARFASANCEAASLSLPDFSSTVASLSFPLSSQLRNFCSQAAWEQSSGSECSRKSLSSASPL